MWGSGRTLWNSVLLKDHQRARFKQLKQTHKHSAPVVRGGLRSFRSAARTQQDERLRKETDKETAAGDPPSLP